MDKFHTDFFHKKKGLIHSDFYYILGIQEKLAYSKAFTAIFQNIVLFLKIKVINLLIFLLYPY